MSLRPTSSGSVPTSTASVARAACPHGNPYLILRDALGPVFADPQFAALFPSHGQPAEAPWRLALVTLLQHAENLSDRRAADAVRGRIDWKYLLGVELVDPGFDASVLSEFCLLPASALHGGGGDAVGDGVGLRWRTTVEGFPPSLLMVASPYDPHAQKRSITWIGYKVHLTEMCDDEQPHLITHVETTPAPVVDRDALAPIHAALATENLLPSTHLVDATYVDAGDLITSRRDHGVALVGPVPKDQQWQARTEGAFTVQNFGINWEQQIATCPAGHTSQSWTVDHNQGRTVMRIRFSSTDCKPCVLKPRCTRSARRLLTPWRQEEHEALQAARAREAEQAFAAEFRRRAGIEGTLSQGVRTMHLRRAHYVGLAKTHLQHVLTAAAINLARLAAWLAGEPRTQTRQSSFVRLMAQPA